MTLDAADLGVVTKLCARMVREAMTQAKRGALPMPVLRPGTIIGWDATGETALVTVDGDTLPVAAINGLNEQVQLGTRVLVQFEPPHGVFVTNVLGRPATTQPHISIVRGYASGASTSSGTYANTPTTGAFTFTKLRDDTAVWIYHSNEGFFISAGAGGHVVWAVNINGVDQPTSDCAVSAVFTRVSSAGSSYIFGLPSGTYGCNLRWAVTGGGVTANVDGETLFHCMVMEVSGG